MLQVILAFADNFIHVNGTATLQSDSETFAGILAESGTSSVDSIVLDASAGASGTIAWCSFRLNNYYS